MKSALCLVGASALLASASPIALKERAMKTVVVEEYVTVTVVAGEQKIKTEPTGAVFVEEPVKVVKPAKPEVVYITTTIAPAQPTQVKEEIKWEEIQYEKPKYEAPKYEAPKYEAPKYEAPKYEAPKYEAPKEQPKKEEPKKEEPKKEEPKKEAPKQEPSKPDLNGDYKKLVVDQHNIHRSNHSAPALEWDETLASYAVTIANKCKMEHDMNQGNGGYGQNLASFGTTGDEMSSIKNKCAAGGVTNQWYNGEVNNWSFYGQENPPASLDLGAYGHFTQMVWKDTKKVGCATVQCPSGSVLSGVPSWFTVCNYSPPGNYGGEYGNNVLPPKQHDPVYV